MIVVVGRVQTDAEKRAELIRIGQEVARASREEAGCIGYRFYADTEREDAYVFVEEWESLAALREHFKTPHIATFMQAVQAAIVATPDVQFHEVARTYGLDDVAG